MIKELFLASVLSTSFSVRTPNDNVKPLDYEFSIKAEDKKGKFTYNLKRDWERELGEKYIDDVFKFSHNGYDVFYYGIDYVNKESKDISYVTKNFGLQFFFKFLVKDVLNNSSESFTDTPTFTPTLSKN